MKHIVKFNEDIKVDSRKIKDILSSDLIKKIKKLKWMGANALDEAYESAKKDIIELIKKEK